MEWSAWALVGLAVWAAVVGLYFGHRVNTAFAELNRLEIASEEKIAQLSQKIDDLKFTVQSNHDRIFALEHPELAGSLRRSGVPDRNRRPLASFD